MVEIVSEFEVGMEVVKKEGYEFDGIIVAVFQNLNGELHVVVESKLIPGLMKIFERDEVEDPTAYLFIPDPRPGEEVT